MKTAGKHTDTRQDLHVRVPLQVKAQLEAMAAELGCPVAQIVRMALLAFVKKRRRRT